MKSLPLLLTVTFIVINQLYGSVFSQETPETCFSRIKGPLRKVKSNICDRKGESYPFEVQDITLGNVLFHKGAQRTSLFTGYTVQLCIFGKFKAGSTIPAKMQHSVHGKVSLIANVIELPVDFCAINTNGCAQTSPQCGTQSPDSSLCVCTDVKVPDIPIDYDNVEVVWKLLDVSDSQPPTNPGDCEKEFSEVNLKKQKNKETLACISIPAQVKRSPPQQFIDAQKEIQG